MARLAEAKAVDGARVPDELLLAYALLHVPQAHRVVDLARGRARARARARARSRAGLRLRLRPRLRLRVGVRVRVKVRVRVRVRVRRGLPSPRGRRPTRWRRGT